MVLRCSGVNNSDVDVKCIRPLDILNVSAEGGIYSRSTDFELLAEVCLLDAWIEFLDKQVELITDRVMPGVADTFVESTAKSMEGVLVSVEGLVASAHPNQSWRIVGWAYAKLGSSDTSELISGEVALVTLHWAFYARSASLQTTPSEPSPMEEWMKLVELSVELSIHAACC